MVVRQVIEAFDLILPVVAVLGLTVAGILVTGLISRFIRPRL